MNPYNISRNYSLEYLSAPDDVPEDHITFFFGMLMLVSLATACIILASNVNPKKYRKSKSLLNIRMSVVGCPKPAYQALSFPSTPSPNFVPAYQSIGSQSIPVYFPPPSYSNSIRSASPHVTV